VEPMKKRTEILLISFWIIGLLTAWPVHAERADRDKPINVEADSVKMDDVKKSATYEGRVVLSQGTLMLTAERVEVRQNENNVITGVATGSPVYFRQKMDVSGDLAEGWAEQIEYDGQTNKLKLISTTGQARLKKGVDELRGNQIVYDSATEFFQAKGNGGAASRVHAVIRPKPPTVPQEAPVQPAAKP